MPNRKPEGIVEEKPDAKPADGAFQAMDQIANWVRFADTKATILGAGLGVTLTMLVTNAKVIATTIKHGGLGSYIVGALALLSLFAFFYTLYWLVRAIGPYSSVKEKELNRFAWPSLVESTADDIASHAAAADVRIDAWQQVLELSVLARHKFGASGRAIKGFAVLVLLGVVCVSTAVGLTG